ncbi:sugar phosphate nucleotidyltransferase [Escherichia coli]
MKNLINAAVNAERSEQISGEYGYDVFYADYLYELLEEDDRDENSSHDFGKDLIPKDHRSRSGLCAPASRSCVQSDPDAEPYWRDVGTLEAYWKANLDLASVVPELDMYDRNWPIRTYNESLPPAKFVQDCSGSHGMTLNSLVSGGWCDGRFGGGAVRSGSRAFA